MKIGDQVVIKNNGAIIEIAEITGENKREWLVGDFWKFNKTTLMYQVPGIWAVYYLLPATPQDVEFFKRNKLLEKLYDTKWHTFALDRLEKICSLL